MASLLPNIPLRFMQPSEKYSLITWLVGHMGLPSRVARQVLQQWGEAMGVRIDPSDYEMINRRLRVTPAKEV